MSYIIHLNFSLKDIVKNNKRLNNRCFYMSLKQVYLGEILDHIFIGILCIDTLKEWINEKIFLKLFKVLQKSTRETYYGII